MGGVIYPPNGKVVGERIIHVDSPALVKRCRELESENETLRCQPATVIEKRVEVTVEKLVEDNALLEKYNHTLREMAELKKFQGPVRIVHEPIIQEVVKEVPVIKEVITEVERVVVKYSYKIALAASAVTGVLGFLIGKIH